MYADLWSEILMLWMRSEILICEVHISWLYRIKYARVQILDEKQFFESN
jgi:hypothetical protein